MHRPSARNRAQARVPDAGRQEDDAKQEPALHRYGENALLHHMKPDELFGDVDALEAWVPVEHHDAISAANLARSTLADTAWLARSIVWHLPGGNPAEDLVQCWYVKGLEHKTKLLCLTDSAGEQDTTERVEAFHDFVRRSNRAWTTVQRVSEVDEVRHHLSRVAADENCHIAVLALTGTPGSVSLNDDDGQLDDLLRGVALRNKVLHFAACSGLRLPPERMESLRRLTKAAVVTGYESYMVQERVEAYAEAFELVLFQELAAASGKGTRGLRAAARKARRYVAGFADDAGFTTSLDATNDEGAPTSGSSIDGRRAD